jgi:hypothetical protein
MMYTKKIKGRILIRIFRIVLASMELGAIGCPLVMHTSL